MTYKVRVFRSKLKEALDAVENGESVYIERGDRMFKITVETGKIDDDYVGEIK